jgi:hypothetical protein
MNNGFFIITRQRLNQYKSIRLSYQHKKYVFISISLQEQGFEFHLLEPLLNTSQLLQKHIKNKYSKEMHSSPSPTNQLSCAVNMELNGDLGLVSSDKRISLTRRPLVLRQTLYALCYVVKHVRKRKKSENVEAKY